MREENWIGRFIGYVAEDERRLEITVKLIVLAAVIITLVGAISITYLGWVAIGAIADYEPTPTETVTTTEGDLHGVDAVTFKNNGEWGGSVYTHGESYEIVLDLNAGAEDVNHYEFIERASSNLFREAYTKRLGGVVHQGESGMTTIHQDEPYNSARTQYIVAYDEQGNVIDRVEVVEETVELEGVVD